MTITVVTHTLGTLTAGADSIFRAWGSGISAGILAAGWVKTADTGQVDWTTVTAPAAGASTVYEVWGAGDSLQTTDPMYIRVTYSRTATGLGPRPIITAGTATDGAGNLTSAPNTNTSVTAARDACSTATTNTGSASVHRSYVIGDTSSLVILFSPIADGVGTYGGLFAIERKRNTDGTPAAGGFSVLWYPGNLQSSSAGSWHTIYTHNQYAQPGVSSTAGPAVPGGLPGSLNAGMRNGVVPLFPVCTGSYPEMGAPSKWLVALFRADLPLGTTFTVTHYGVSSTFMAVGPEWATASSTLFSLTAGARLVPAVRVA